MIPATLAGNQSMALQRLPHLHFARWNHHHVASYPTTTTSLR